MKTTKIRHERTTQAVDAAVTTKQRTRRIRRRKGDHAAAIKRYYFTAETQEAIGRYQQSDDKQTRDEIYVASILPAFDSLVENLISIYKFVGLHETREDLQADCITFLFETLRKFDPLRGTKAFSYFNVVAKNWLIVQAKKRQKNMLRIVSLDATDTLGRTGYVRFALGAEGYTPVLEQDVERFIVPAPDDILQAHEQVDVVVELLIAIRKKLTAEADIKCIDSVITLFEHRDDLPFFNKRAVFMYMRDMSGLSPKQLTTSIGVLKRYYNLMKRDEDIGIF